MKFYTLFWPCFCIVSLSLKNYQCPIKTQKLKIRWLYIILTWISIIDILKFSWDILCIFWMFWYVLMSHIFTLGFLPLKISCGENISTTLKYVALAQYFFICKVPKNKISDKERYLNICHHLATYLNSCIYPYCLMVAHNFV